VFLPATTSAERPLTDRKTSLTRGWDRNGDCTGSSSERLPTSAASPRWFLDVRSGRGGSTTRTPSAPNRSHRPPALEVASLALRRCQPIGSSMLHGGVRSIASAVPPASGFMGRCGNRQAAAQRRGALGRGPKARRQSRSGPSDVSGPDPWVVAQVVRARGSRVQHLPATRSLHHVLTIDIGSRVARHSQNSLRRLSSTGHHRPTTHRNHMKLTDLHRGVRDGGRDWPARGSGAGAGVAGSGLAGPGWRGAALRVPAGGARGWAGGGGSRSGG
jgi:hypothetical protein